MYVTIGASILVFALSFYRYRQSEWYRKLNDDLNEPSLKNIEGEIKEVNRDNANRPAFCVGNTIFPPNDKLEKAAGFGKKIRVFYLPNTLLIDHIEPLKSEK